MLSSLFGKKSEEEEPTHFGNARVFKHEELKTATKSFTTELGFGGFGGLGTVYLATLTDGQIVAVEVLPDQNPKFCKELITEIMALSNLRHKNLATLHGCTNPRRKELLLVYEYVPNGTLWKHLYGGQSVLTLAVRVQIAVETAEALVYLNALDPPIIHQDLRPYNIMLDDDFHVKLALPVKRVTEHDVKNNVPSFGTVLAQLISGKGAYDSSRGPGNAFLAHWIVNKIIVNNFDDFVDPNLGYNSDLRLKTVIHSLVKVSGECLHSNSIMRPTMEHVLIKLNQINDYLQEKVGLNAPPLQPCDDGLIDDSLGKKNSDEEEPTSFGLAHVFKHEELKKATNSFTTELGVGGFGSVYLGTLRGQKVAVKVLHNNNPKRLKEFITEVMVLSNLRHKNLVTLHGCTNPRDKELLLVYDYVPNGTVEDHLHHRRSDLTMAVRVQIAVETAEALVYLHDRVPPLIHRDLKTANIMLDHDFHVKVGDLGMSRLLPWDATQVTTVAQGTLGYRDPEYDRTLILSVKSDVYSFGVMVVEFISGEMAIDVNRAPDNIYLADLALNKIINNKLDDFVDPKLGYKSNVCIKRTINSLAELACRCLHSTGTMRPTMKQVLTELKQIEDVLQQKGGINVPLQELGDDSLTDGGEATIEDPGNGASIYGPGTDNISLLDNKCLSFDIKDLMRASEDVMGKGKLGTTYRATLESGPVIIVKRLGVINSLSKEEFSQQMRLLQQVKHENLVEIIGFFDSEDEKLIIYENVPGASLYKLLHDYLGAGEGPLNWGARLSIVKGMARGLAHLHNAQYSSKILHANLKSSNVLVVQDNRCHPATYHAKLTDFGFLPFFQSPGQVRKFAIASTPELSREKKPSEKADVYCFGLVLLEVIMGKAPDEEDLRERVILTPKDNWITILDMEIAAEVDGHEEEMRTLIQIALECTSAWPDRRPSMRELVREMEEIGEPDREEGSPS